MKEYEYIVVESFKPEKLGPRHGEIHIRPVEDQGAFKKEMFVECAKELSDTTRYPLGSKFRIKAKITRKQGGIPFIYSHYKWKVEVLD